ncbi:MAG: gluconate 2-dehydrogenase subunit 3 family protein [Acidobacteriota bacterium]
MAEAKTISRREAIRTIGASSIVPLLSYLGPGGLFASNAQTHPRVPVQSLEQPWSARFLNVQEVETAAAVAELIIPETDTPTARAAKAHQYIDYSLSLENDQVQQSFKRGLAWLDEKSRHLFGKDFLELEVEQQNGILNLIAWEDKASPEDREGTLFFKDIKALTVFAYYTSEIGIHEELQYPRETFLLEFPGCEHREHLDWKPRPTT